MQSRDAKQLRAAETAAQVLLQGRVPAESGTPPPPHSQSDTTGDSVHDLLAIQRRLKMEKLLLEEEKCRIDQLLDRAFSLLTTIPLLTLEIREYEENIERVRIREMSDEDALTVSSSFVSASTLGAEKLCFQKLLCLCRRFPGFLAQSLFHHFLSDKLSIHVRKEIEPLARMIQLSLYGNLYDQQDNHANLAFLKELLVQSFPRVATPRVVFENPLVKKILPLYCRRIGRRYLHAVLSQPLLEMLQEDDFSVELNPTAIRDALYRQAGCTTKLGDFSSPTIPRSFSASAMSPSMMPPSPSRGKKGQDDSALKKVQVEEEDIQRVLRKNSASLYSICTKIMSNVLSSLDGLPYGVRFLAKTLKQNVLALFPGEAPESLRAVLGTFLFVNFLVPAIADPEKHGIISSGTIRGDQRESLAAITTVLTYMACGSEFPERSPTRSMNHFIRENSEALERFFDAVTNVSDLDQEMETLSQLENPFVKSPSAYIIKSPALQQITSHEVAPGVLSRRDLQLLHTVLWNFASSHSPSAEQEISEDGSESQKGNMARVEAGPGTPLSKFIDEILELDVPDTMDASPSQYVLLHDEREFFDPSLSEELFAGSNPPTRIAKIRLRQLLCSIKCLEEGIVGKSLTEFLNQVVERERSFGSVLVAATVKDITCELENLAPPYRTHDFQSLLREILDDIVERRHIFQEFSDIKQSLLLRIENLSHVTKELSAERERSIFFLETQRMRPFLEKSHDMAASLAEDLRRAAYIEEMNDKLRSFMDLSKCEVKRFFTAMGKSLTAQEVDHAVLHCQNTALAHLQHSGMAFRDDSKDMRMVQRMMELSAVTPKMLDIRKPFVNEKPWDIARQELRKMSIVHSPQDKLKCIVKFSSTLYELMKLASSVHNLCPSVDDFLPILIYNIVQTRPMRLCSDLLITGRYLQLIEGALDDGAEEDSLPVQADYWFPHFEAACLYIEKTDSEQIRSEARHRKGRVRSPSISPPSSRDSSPRVSRGQSCSPSPPRSRSGSLRTTFFQEPVEGPSSASSVGSSGSLSGPGSLQTRGVTRGRSRSLFVSNPDGVASRGGNGGGIFRMAEDHTSGRSSVLSSPGSPDTSASPSSVAAFVHGAQAVSSHTPAPPQGLLHFCRQSPDTLSVSDLSQLLEEYRAMAGRLYPSLVLHHHFPHGTSPRSSSPTIFSSSISVEDGKGGDPEEDVHGPSSLSLTPPMEPLAYIRRGTRSSSVPEPHRATGSTLSGFQSHYQHRPLLHHPHQSSLPLPALSPPLPGGRRPSQEGEDCETAPSALLSTHASSGRLREMDPPKDVDGEGGEAEGEGETEGAKVSS